MRQKSIFLFILSLGLVPVFSLTVFYEAHVDTNHKVVTTPAFMCETELHHIYDGIGAMVKNVLKLTGK